MKAMKKKVNPFWMALCILLSLAILGLCVFLIYLVRN